MQLHIDVPDDLVTWESSQLAALAREALVVRLYALGEISSGEGGQALSISRREFIDLLGRYNVSIFDDEANVLDESDLG